MAKSKFEYVKQFERDDILLPATFIVVRIDGRGFHQFTTRHQFTKPNDDRGLHLMNRCAEHVISVMNDIVIAYGHSDEYSFVFNRDTKVYKRRRDKIVTTIVSAFSSAYVFNWRDFFPDTPLQYAPQFDGRAVVYPNETILRDYLSWRQADCHINNMYNTCYWKLVLEGKCSGEEAERRLKDTVSADKNEMLFSEFNTNYNNEAAIYRKGTVICRQPVVTNEQRGQMKWPVGVLHVDIISDTFWAQRPWILSTRRPTQVYREYIKTNQQQEEDNDGKPER